jgi:hypothetical protein
LSRVLGSLPGLLSGVTGNVGHGVSKTLSGVSGTVKGLTGAPGGGSGTSGASNVASLLRYLLGK